MAFRTAKQPAGNSVPFRPLPLMQVAAKANRALGDLNSDLRAGGFGRNAQGLARELYASFTATIVATKGTDAEAMAWAIGRAVAIDLDRAGFRRGAGALLAGLIEFGNTHADPKILTRLRKTEEELRKKSGWRWFAPATPPPPQSQPDRARPPEPAAAKTERRQEPQFTSRTEPPVAPNPPPAPAAEAPAPQSEPPLMLTEEAGEEAAPVMPETPVPVAAEPAAPVPEGGPQFDGPEPGAGPEEMSAAEMAEGQPEAFDAFAGLSVPRSEAEALSASMSRRAPIEDRAAEDPEDLPSRDQIAPPPAAMEEISEPIAAAERPEALEPVTALPEAQPEEPAVSLAPADGTAEEPAINMAE